ncbi:Uncharacterised protein [Lactiplantibacillus plantarum subsp. plantarum]|nr:Uncharacterised protein [Lactiplantibacillus plantarum subsp. plantarum]
MSKRIFATQNDFRLHAHEYLNNTFLAVPWNKLYKTSYLKNHHLEFPQVKWDDLHFNMEVIRNIERVGVLDIAEYHFFRSRPGSETTKVSMKSFLQIEYSNSSIFSLCMMIGKFRIM